MSTPIPILLDEFEIKQHFDLNSEDICYYWRKYTTGKGYAYGETNQLIKNFRIPVTDVHRLSHKKKAIEQIASEFMQIAAKETTYTNYTYIPIPTSNGRNNPDYDDRLIKVLNLVSKHKKIAMDIRELVIQPERTKQSHTLPAEKRLSVEELCNLYIINQSLLEPSPKRIIIFDDVLTKGTHFKAVERVLKKYYPETPIIGLFIASSIYPAP